MNKESQKALHHVLGGLVLLLALAVIGMVI